MYSFGVVMWEVMERRIPYETNEGFPESMVGAIGEIRGGVRPVVGGGCEEFGGGVVGLMRRCWDAEPGSRPTFAEALEELGCLRSNQHDSLTALVSPADNSSVHSLQLFRPL